jgi:type IX secretion system PorP/SprF family membrane protein
MSKILFTLTLFFSLSVAKAQQLHFTSQYLQHNAMYNPAAAGFGQHPVIGVSYRSMWSAFPGNPRTFMVYGDTKWEKMNCGISTYIYRDETGPTSRTGIQAAYSYHVKTGANSSIGLGIELRGLQYAIDRGKISDALGSDLVLSSGNSKFKLDAGAGIYYTNGKLSAGAAVSQLIQSKLAFGDATNTTLRGKLYRHYNVMANYIIQTGENTKVIPNAMVRFITNAPAEFDFGCKVDYKDKIWWALNWRLRQFWSLQMGFKLMERVGFAYSYDYYASPFSDYNTGNNAHELGLRFEFPSKKSGK